MPKVQSGTAESAVECFDKLAEERTGVRFVSWKELYENWEKLTGRERPDHMKGPWDGLPAWLRDQLGNSQTSYTRKVANND